MTENRVANALPIAAVIALVAGIVGAYVQVGSMVDEVKESRTVDHAQVTDDLNDINTSVLLLSKEVAHTNELNSIQFKSSEARMARLEEAEDGRKELLNWITQFHAMNPSLSMPDLP